MAVALVALFVAMGGSAYAAGLITSGDIKNNTIRSRDVRNGGLIGKDIRANKVGGRAIKESTLGTVPSAVVAEGTTHFSVVNSGGSARRRWAVDSSKTPVRGRLSCC